MKNKKIVITALVILGVLVLIFVGVMLSPHNRAVKTARANTLNQLTVVDETEYMAEDWQELADEQAKITEKVSKSRNIDEIKAMGDDYEKLAKSKVTRAKKIENFNKEMFKVIDTFEGDRKQQALGIMSEYATKINGATSDKALNKIDKEIKEELANIKVAPPKPKKEEKTIKEMTKDGAEKVIDTTKSVVNKVGNSTPSEIKDKVVDTTDKVIEDAGLTDEVNEVKSNTLNVINQYILKK